MGHTINEIRARQILDSRGNPTIEVEVETKSGARGLSSVPSGVSKGTLEATELRDGGRRYHGMGVLSAISSVNNVIAQKLIGVDAGSQRAIDQTMIELDGTREKGRLGSNAILGVSLACVKAAATSYGKELYEYIGGTETRLLPMPFFNVINGGRHAGNRLDFQEFLVVPNGADNFGEAIRIGSEIYSQLRAQLLSSYGKMATNVGDEGGFSPPMSRPEEALEAIVKAIEEMGYGGIAVLALDIAATTFFCESEGYLVVGRTLNRDELIDYCRELVEAYPIISIEDPLHEDDFEGFAEATKRLHIQILGDDIFVTNISRLRKGIEMGAANGLIWKVNQVGTLTEALETADLAKRSGYTVQASHRSGDTEDTFVADLAVGISCGQIKAGAPCRGERTAKYNRLLRIEEQLGKRARFPMGLLSR